MTGMAAARPKASSRLTPDSTATKIMGRKLKNRTPRARRARQVRRRPGGALGSGRASPGKVASDSMSSNCSHAPIAAMYL
jgi:hypothetical protein